MISNKIRSISNYNKSRETRLSTLDKIGSYHMSRKKNSDFIKKLLDAEQEREYERRLLLDLGSFDESVLDFQQAALTIWKSIEADYKSHEEQFGVPYAIAETPKLYALDPLVIASPFLKSEEELEMVCRIFAIFYLMVHFFDDHVEHRDKFYSKFTFRSEEDLDTQKGAAPFSFMLLSEKLIHDCLNNLDSRLKPEVKDTITQAINNKLLLQTKYFALERKRLLSVEDVLEIKQRQVSGVTMTVVADILKPLVNLSDKDFKALHDGLIFLGSLTQITDDIRDASIDATLRNANIVNACMVEYGREEGVQKLSDIYLQEEANAERLLKKLYKTHELNRILSIPFYPFFVNKEQLREGKLGVLRTDGRPLHRIKE